MFVKNLVTVLLDQCALIMFVTHFSHLYRLQSQTLPPLSLQSLQWCLILPSSKPRLLLPVEGRGHSPPVADIQNNSIIWVTSANDWQGATWLLIGWYKILTLQVEPLSRHTGSTSIALDSDWSAQPNAFIVSANMLYSLRLAESSHRRF